ncbi:MAG: cph1 [Rhodocyclaceae bacterium]|nr:cph1 [Rhodocyclaceae bacterium]
MDLLARTRLIATLVITATLLLTGAFLMAQQRMREAQAAKDGLEALSAEVHRLRTAAFDYVQQPETRARAQTEAEFQRLHALVTGDWLATVVSQQAAEEGRLRREVRDALDQSEEIFRQLPAGDSDPAFAERDRLTRTHLLLQTQSLASAIAALHPILSATAVRARNRAGTIGVALGGLLVAMALLSVALLEHYILRPLGQLRQMAIGHGEAAAPLPGRRTDEIGHLADALDGILARLEAANKELEAFAYSVSHDLRAPLRAIDGFSRKVVANYGDRLDDEGRRLLQVVRDNAQRMNQLINDILAFSRTGRREMAPEPVDMEAMAKSVAEEARQAEPGRAIEFAFLPLPPTRGDPALLRQVWVNLIGNAVKFTRRRPVAHIEVGGSTEGGENHYWVKDDGAGFDMRYAGKLFGVFQRLHSQEEFEGTGVGLAIAQRILFRHQGRIWAEGQPDGGATFHFALPIPSPNAPLSRGQKS